LVIEGCAAAAREFNADSDDCVTTRDRGPLLRAVATRRGTKPQLNWFLDFGIAYVKKWQIFAVGIIAALALWFFPLYQNVIAGAAAILVVGIVGFGFWLRPRRDIFHVRTTVWRVAGDGKLACEHEQLAVKIELARLWLLFVPTALAVTFLVVTSAYGTLWNIGVFDWIPLGYGPLVVNWFTLVLVIGPLYVWVSERRVLREAEAASAQSVSTGGKRVGYVFLDSTGTKYAGEGIYFGLVKSQVLASLVFYAVRNPDLNRIGMRLLFDSVLSLIISGVPSSLYSGRVPSLSVLKLQASSSLLKFDGSIGSPKEQVSFERWLKAQPQFELRLPRNVRRSKRERVRTKR
jgi:hypothetical protein